LTRLRALATIGGPLKTIGRYELIRELARGGMGEVYLAYDPRMKRELAIKLLRPEYCERESERRRFEHEAVAAARLEHEAIVPVYDFGDHEGRAYLVMRLMSGGTLADRIKDGPMPLRACARALSRVASALDAAHGIDLIHRDVKPANILFDGDGRAFLSDFGVAKIAREADAAGDGRMVGTPRYMSPEQAQNFPVDPRSDIYSLGVVAYHAVTGRAPFDGNSIMVLAFAHAMRAPLPVTEVADHLPKIADKIFTKALSKAPSLRYSSASHFADDIETLAAGRWYLLELSDHLQGVRPDAPVASKSFLEGGDSKSASESTGFFNVDETAIWGPDDENDDGSSSASG
jgi:serine/threonine-protein kinase